MCCSNSLVDDRAGCVSDDETEKGFLVFSRKLLCEELFGDDIDFKYSIFALVPGVDLRGPLYLRLSFLYAFLPDSGHDSAIDGAPILEKLQVAKFPGPGINTVVAHVLSFTKALLEEFDASGTEYQPVGKGAYECGKLARYLKDVLEGALAEPAFAGNDKLVFEFLKGLSATDKKTLWRTARWYNYLVELTLPEDEE